MDDANKSAVTLTAKCHCGLASYTYTIPATAFPLKSAVCHCGSCRRASGQLFSTFAVIPVTNRPDVSHLVAYASSPGLSRYFCPHCGASILNQEQDEWEFTCGVLDRTRGLLNRVQIFIDDTLDGGAAAWLADAVSEMHAVHRDSARLTARAVKAMAEDHDLNENAGDVLPASCHCGDVSFNISSTKEKYPAGLDACTSCRVVAGFEITAWATVPQSSITMSNGSPLDLTSPSMKTYNTSPNVVRYFCRRCGATIFYLKEGRDTIDVGVGLLQAKSGSRAEEFLAWEKYGECVAYQEDAIDPVFVRALADGIRKSRVHD